MNELYLMKKAVWTEAAVDDAAALAELKADFPGRAARRMTRLGMQLSRVLAELDVDEACSLVYATTYSETRTIEKFLDSFPYPSPQAFQTSIHPGGVEQFLIRERQPVTEFFPLAGGVDLLFRALDTAWLCAGETIVICGGEERGTWLKGPGISSETNYAWAVQVRKAPAAGSLGRIAWEGGSDAAIEATEIQRFVQALQAQSAYHHHAPGGGEMELSWSV